MQATAVPEMERLYGNDLVYKFSSKPAGLTITMGRVKIDDPKGIPHVNWYSGETREESLDDVVKNSRLFILNREVHIGSVAIMRQWKEAGFVTGTRHRVLGLISKTLKDGTSHQYILPSIPSERLKKLFPVKIGDHILAQGWIGMVTNVLVKTEWTFGLPSDTATSTVPVTTMEELNLKVGMKVDKLPEKIATKECIFNTRSWLGLCTSRFRKRPATLKEIVPSSLDVCWIQQYDPPGSCDSMPASVISADESVKVFHFSKDDWDYYSSNESFKMTWTSQDQDNVLPYEQWQSQMLITSTGLLYGEDPLPRKRIKGNQVFSLGETVTVTPLALQTEVAVTFPNGATIINHKMMASDIPELGLHVMPRMEFSNPPIQLKNMDLVLDNNDASPKYGFVLDPSAKDGKVLMRWIYDMGPNDTKEKSEYASERDLTPHHFQREFNPKSQTKIALTRNGKLGTFRGIINPSCKAVIRLVGTFDDAEVWPHEVQFLTKIAKYDSEEQKWSVEQCPANDYKILEATSDLN